MHGALRGFTLVEMLVVISIAGLLSLLVTAGLQSVLGSAYTSETSNLTNTLMRARAYAMANNTYVFVGLEEVNDSKSSSGPQTTGVGRLGVVVVATNDGTRGYNPAAPASIPDSTFAPTTQLTVVSPLHPYENIHAMTTTEVTTAGTTISNLPDSGAGASYNVKSTSSLSTFNWPLGSSGSNAQYSFGSNGTVIQFNPLGEAQIITAANTDSLLQWIEIDLEPTHGSSTSGTSAQNLCTILIDGASGSVSAYRR